MLPVSASIEHRSQELESDCKPTSVVGVGEVLVVGPATGAGSSRARTAQFRSLLLTKASIRPSGDHEGTLIVPCPPYT